MGRLGLPSGPVLQGPLGSAFPLTVFSQHGAGPLGRVCRGQDGAKEQRAELARKQRKPSELWRLLPPPPIPASVSSQPLPSWVGESQALCWARCHLPPLSGSQGYSGAGSQVKGRWRAVSVSPHCPRWFPWRSCIRVNVIKGKVVQVGRAVSRDGLARAGREEGEQRQGPTLEGSACGCKSPVTVGDLLVLLLPDLVGGERMPGVKWLLPGGGGPGILSSELR